MIFNESFLTYFYPHFNLLKGDSIYLITYLILERVKVYVCKLN